MTRQAGKDLLVLFPKQVVMGAHSKKPSRALPTRFEREPNFFLYKIELPLKVAPSIPELLNWRSGGLDFSILSLNKRGLNNRQATD